MLKQPANLFLFALLVAGSASGNSEIEALNRDAWSDQVLAAHNSARASYGARPLQWASDLYNQTSTYAWQCKFAHSNSQSQYGENLYASSNQSASISDAVKAWMSESSKYDYNNPTFNSATGHFTQIVWKSTTQVTCAMANCPPGSIFSQSQPSKFIVCRYTPPGNYEGQFTRNVGRPVA